MPGSIDLKAAAHTEMVREGFEPDFPADVVREVRSLAATSAIQPTTDSSRRDLRNLAWSSIDNPESRDLDQVEVAEVLPNGDIKVLVGVADVDSLVIAGSALDRHAGHNTTSVYCGIVTYPMLPEQLSTNLTSLNEGVDRLAVVIELVITTDGEIRSHDLYRAVLRNGAQLDYPGVGAWLEAAGDPPAKVRLSAALEQQLRLQDRAAQALRARRRRDGALELETIEATPVATAGRITDLVVRPQNRATQLIEDLMIAANTAMATFLDARGSATIRRVVKVPERWDRIVVLAAGLGERLPATPDSGALSAFLAKWRTADPEHFPDLSLAVVKLMGPGVYLLEKPGEKGEGHFGLAVHDYTHSTAPNRRYADLITQRLLKAVLARAKPAYPDDALALIADQCTRMEDAARKVERTCRKQAAAELLAGRIGESFDGIVTGASAKGTFVRTLRPPAEGMVVRGQQGMDVGDKVTVRLVGANPVRGFIDFAR
jgi:exoribonuclease-2